MVVAQSDRILKVGKDFWPRLSAAVRDQLRIAIILKMLNFLNYRFFVKFSEWKIKLIVSLISFVSDFLAKKVKI